MNRRAFLTTASVGTLGAIAGCTNPCPPGGSGAGGSGGGLQGTVPGGGPPALQDITYQDRDYEAQTVEELQQHAQQSDGRIVWLPASNGYDLSGSDLSLENITLASGRGENSQGATIYTTDQGADSPAWSGGSNGTGLITLNDNARISGVEIKGPHTNLQEHPGLRGYLPFAPGGSSERESWRRARFARGISIEGDDAVVDNCEIWGFSVQGIAVGPTGPVSNAQVRYSYIHDCMMTSYGYCVDCRHGDVTVYRCYLDAARHAMSGSGMGDASYFVIESTIGPFSSSHPIDMHRVGNNQSGSDDPSAVDFRWRAGNTMLVRGCDIMAIRVPDLPFINHNRGGSFPHCSIRGIPKDAFVFENNRCSHSSPADAINQSGVPGRYKEDENGFVNIHYSGNEFDVDFEVLSQVP